MQITPPVPIPIFYWREDLDAFLAARAIKTLLDRNPAEMVPVSDGDTIVGLNGKYPIFIGVLFTKMGALPDMSGAVNAVIISRYDQSELLMKDFDNLPKRDKMPLEMQQKLRNMMRWRIVFDDYSAYARRAPAVMASVQRAEELTPPFVKELIALFEKPEPTEDEELFLKGMAKEESFLNNDYPTFEKDFVVKWTFQKKEITENAIEKGRASLEEEDKMIRLMVQRTAMIGEFAGHKVKIAHFPEEMAEKAGWLMAKNMPFAVVYEDILLQNKRVYHLYSLRGGLNVMDVAKGYNPVGNARKCTFTMKINFTNHNWLPVQQN